MRVPCKFYARRDFFVGRGLGRRVVCINVSRIGLLFSHFILFRNSGWCWCSTAALAAASAAKLMLRTNTTLALGSKAFFSHFGVGEIIGSQGRNKPKTEK